MISLLEKTKFDTKSGQFLSNLEPGHKVLVVKKENQKNGVLTKGHISKILTKKKYHSRGLKVQLHDGTVGRVQKIIKKH